MKEADFYLVAHDLRAPLMSVKGLVNLIKSDTERKNWDQYFSLLERSIDNMDTSIKEALDARKQQQVVQEVELRDVIEGAIQSLLFMEGAEFFRIELSIPPHTTILSDHKSTLLSVFSNLISNAIRYRDPRKASYLKISADTSGEFAKITLEDNGIGIEEGVRERIFDKFFIVDDSQGGTGLGLYSVKTSIEKMEGSIDVKSWVGVGTTFIIQFPLVQKRKTA